MTVLTLPALSRSPARQRFMLVPNTRVFQSPLDGTEQTLLMPGTAWRMRLDWPRLVGDDRALMEAFLAQLEGRAARIYVFDYSRRNPRGTHLGTPRVKGAGQTGAVLATDGWQVDQPAALKPGDWFAVDTAAGRELKKITATIAADANGEATLAFMPTLRQSPPDDALIQLQDASGIFRLADDEQQGWTAMPALRAEEISLQLIESFTG